MFLHCKLEVFIIRCPCCRISWTIPAFFTYDIDGCAKAPVDVCRGVLSVRCKLVSVSRYHVLHAGFRMLWCYVEPDCRCPSKVRFFGDSCGVFKELRLDDENH